MKKLLTVFLFLVLGSFISGNAHALSTYIPHITGGDAHWTDYLQINNNTSSEASFTLALYNKDNQSPIYSQVHSVGGFSRSQIELKTLNPAAETGIITYTEPGLVFRVSYKGINGGVAEFKTIDTLNSNIGHYFSDFVSFVEWKGVAIANMGTTSADVTLYALGRSVQGSGGSILGTFALVIPPKDKIVGFHSAWFSSVELSQIESIVAVTSSQSLCGITIVGDFALARLLFTPAALVTNFNANAQTTGWDLNSTVNMDGTFPATADLALTTNGVLFSAVLTTKLIGGASEVHSFTLDGTTNGTTYTVTNQTFSITVGGTLETFTMNASFVITGNSLSGSGTLTGSHNGSFTVTGAKKI